MQVGADFGLSSDSIGHDTADRSGQPSASDGDLGPHEARGSQEADTSFAAGANHLLAEGVSIAYSSGKQPEGLLAVDTLDFTVGRGEFVCIVGPSGCGKTTFLNAVAGFLPISSGKLDLDGVPITQPGPDRAMVFQQPNLLPWRTVLRNVTYGLEMSGIMRRADAKVRAMGLLDLVGLADFKDARPGSLSGGMRQRVNLARALAVEPQLLLLDEPFASVDAQTREVLQNELLRIRERTNFTALFVTHDIAESVFLADRVCVFSARPGRVIREVVVDLPKPRKQEARRTSRFVEYVDEVATALAEGSVVGDRPDTARDREAER
jgi:NitT/TauT family transport system ATP-binding protein